MNTATPTINADQLINQLGGAPRLSAMIRAQIMTAPDYVCIQFKGNRRMDRVVIRLNDSDLYDLEFMKYNSKTFTCDTKAAAKNVYADGLVQVFEKETGLYLTL